MWTYHNRFLLSFYFDIFDIPVEVCQIVCCLEPSEYEDLFQRAHLIMAESSIKCFHSTREQSIYASASSSKRGSCSILDSGWKLLLRLHTRRQDMSGEEKQMSDSLGSAQTGMIKLDNKCRYICFYKWTLHLN